MPPGSSKRPGSTSALSIGSPRRRRRRESCTTRCSRSIRSGSTLVRSGLQRVHSSRRKERRHEGWLQNNARVRVTGRLLTGATRGASHWRLLRRDLLGDISVSEFYRAQLVKVYTKQATSEQQ